MSFVKLDCGILDSTIWVDRPAREVFITALLMAAPFELEHDEPQLEVREMQPTGWTIPAGWYGLVRAAGVGIVRRAGLEESDGLPALERLGSPEGASRSPDFDGRRLARISGGFLVLNYFKYRERDYTAAERVKRYRQREALRRNSDKQRRNVTEAEAEVETEAEAKKGGSSFFASASVSTEDPPPASQVPPKGGRRTTAAWKRLPQGETLTPDRRSFAERYLKPADVAEQWERFADYTFKAARTDVDATWRNWCRTAADRERQIPRPFPSKQERVLASVRKMLEAGQQARIKNEDRKP